MLSAIRRASISGTLISSIFRWTFLPIVLLEHLAQRSTFAPCLPITMPGFDGVQRDIDLVGRALDLDLGDARARQLAA